MDKYNVLIVVYT